MACTAEPVAFVRRSCGVRAARVRRVCGVSVRHALSVIARARRPARRRATKTNKLIVDLINESGISGMRFSISETAKWGDVAIGPKIIDAGVKRRMKAALKDIQSGKFAKGWVREYQTGYKKYNSLLKAGEKHGIEKVGQRLRG